MSGKSLSIKHGAVISGIFVDGKVLLDSMNYVYGRKKLGRAVRWQDIHMAMQLNKEHKLLNQVKRKFKRNTDLWWMRYVFALEEAYRRVKRR